jgi:hypothetical protein
MSPSTQVNPALRSAAAVLQAEIAALDEWLTAQGLEHGTDCDHAHEGTRDRLYWRYGYFVGLKQALEMLTGHGATLH